MVATYTSAAWNAGIVNVSGAVMLKTPPVVWVVSLTVVSLVHKLTTAEKSCVAPAVWPEATSELSKPVKLVFVPAV